MNPLIPTGLDIALSAVLLLVALYSVAAFVSVVRASFTSGLVALGWTLVVLLIPIVGATVWFTIGRKRYPARSLRKRTS